MERKLKQTSKERPFGSKPRSSSFKESSERARFDRPQVFKQPKPEIQTTTLWDFPSQHYGDSEQGSGEYAGVTPSYVIWNLLQRYTKPDDIVLDPMCGSGTTVDVCKDLKRKILAFDLKPSRNDIKKSDARQVGKQVPRESVDFVFLDPPYSNHIHYNDDPSCIGNLDARVDDYFGAMEEVFASLYGTLKDGGYLGLYVQDSFAKGKPFVPLGFELFLRLSAVMDPVDVVAVVRHHKSLKRNHWHTSAIEGNYFLRGFNYLFVFRKNKHRNDKMLRHEASGQLSQYFKNAAKGQPDDVITPEKLMDIIRSDDKEAKAVENRESQKEKTSPAHAPKRHTSPHQPKQRDSKPWHKNNHSKPFKKR
jgi:DNA modification methylase